MLLNCYSKTMMAISHQSSNADAQRDRWARGDDNAVRGYKSPTNLSPRLPSKAVLMRSTKRRHPIVVLADEVRKLARAVLPQPLHAVWLKCLTFALDQLLVRFVRAVSATRKSLERISLFGADACSNNPDLLL